MGTVAASVKSRTARHRPREPQRGLYAAQMIDWSTCEAVERQPERYSGAWVFRGTRVPVSSLFENLEADVSVTEYVEAFEGVTIEQVRRVLEHAARSALAPA